jgi:hypothetical protein
VRTESAASFACGIVEHKLNTLVVNIQPLNSARVFPTAFKVACHCGLTQVIASRGFGTLLFLDQLHRPNFSSGLQLSTLFFFSDSTIFGNPQWSSLQKFDLVFERDKILQPRPGLRLRLTILIGFFLNFAFGFRAA